MRKPIFLASVVSICAAITLMAAKPDPIVMTVGGRDVRLSEFEYLYNKNKSQQETPVTIDEYVGMFADYKRKVLAAEAAGLDTTASFRDDFRRYSRELALPYLVDSVMADSLARVIYDRLHRNVSVSHILIGSDRTKDPEAQRALADSLRNIIAQGADFTTIARQYSSDRSAKETGGRMGYLSAGRLPYQIEDAIFDLKPGELSEVVMSPVGAHFFKVDDIRPDIGQVKTRHILKLFRGHSAADTLQALQLIDSAYRLVKGGEDFAEVAKQFSDDGSRKDGGALPWFGAGMMVPEFEKVSFSLKDGEVSEPFTTRFGYHIVKREGYKSVGTFDEERKSIDEIMKRDGRAELPRKRMLSIINAKLGPAAEGSGETDRAIEYLEKENPDYANIRNEYHDGFLACEISEREVWKRSTDDADGLNAYFEAHRGNYTWDKPRFKGYIIMATSDSVANAARQFVAELTSTPTDSLGRKLRRKFGNQVRFERVLAAQGANPIIDYVAFGGQRPAPLNNWTSFVPCRYRIVAQPETAADVKGLVSMDYQKQLEKDWLDRLRRAYPVKVNEKVLKQVK